GELARREYAYLPLLTRSQRRNQLVLHDLLSGDPGFFVEVICDAYRPASREIEEPSPTDERRLRAEFAWELLRSWKRPPGLEGSEDVKPDRLREWIARARALAEERDRKKIADQQIGNVLYHYPADPDDSAWPH